MKKNIKKNEIFSYENREKRYHYYFRLFYNIFMSKYKIKGFSYKQNDYLFRKFFTVGKCAIINIPRTEEIALADFGTVSYDYLDFPAEVTLINNRGVSFIPTTPQVVDETVVIGWIQRSGAPVSETVKLFASRLANIDMLINIAEKAQKTPWLIAVPPGSEKKVREFKNALEADEPTLFFEIDDFDPKALISGAPYLIDKLYNYKQAVFGEALTFFGVSNLGNIEKNERMITDEVNANNELTYHCADTFKQPLQEFIERTNEVLKHDFELIENAVNYNTVKKGVFGEDKNEDEGDETDV